MEKRNKVTVTRFKIEIHLFSAKEDEWNTVSSGADTVRHHNNTNREKKNNKMKLR